MAEHADSEQLDAIANPGDTVVDSTTESKPLLRQRLPRVVPVVALGLLLVAAAGVLAGWLGFRAHAAQQQQALLAPVVPTRPTSCGGAGAPPPPTDVRVDVSYFSKSGCSSRSQLWVGAPMKLVTRSRSMSWRA